MTFDPKLDLMFERTIDVPREVIWKCWTRPELLQKWFCPAPWHALECKMDLRAGGAFDMMIRSPEGKVFPSHSCFLEIVKNEKLVWTNAVHSNYRPGSKPEYFFFTATLLLEALEHQTKYKLIITHQNEDDCERHKAMGFHEGCGKALDQLIELSKTLK